MPELPDIDLSSLAGPDPKLPEIPPGGGLSVRLLVLTIIFVMVAEILIFLPTVSRFRVEYLNQKLAAAHLVLTALEAADDSINPMLRDRLLDQAGMLGMTVTRPGMMPRTLGPRMPPRIPVLYDLREAFSLELVSETLACMWRTDDLVIGVTGWSPSDRQVLVEVVLDELPLRVALWEYGWDVLVISIFISVTTAALVYASIQWLAVRPLRRITASMTAFKQAPDDPRRIIVPENRADEAGVAERTLAEMQHQLRDALLQRERLAGVGTAVTKISHDLKNILATAALESDKLEANPDAEVRRITAGIVKSIDRAVKLAGSTLRFAKEGLPHVNLQRLHLADCVNDLRAHVEAGIAPCLLKADAVENVSFAGDPELFHRALENLIRNAADAGAKHVTLSTRHEGGRYFLLVGDDGPGLPKKALDNLFVPFAGSAKSGGSGLGLPIARELMRLQGGDILLRSTSKAGTCFVMRLPEATEL